MQGALQDKIVLVSGGAGLLGRQFVRAIAAEGGTAIVADLEFPAARPVGGADFVDMDITDGASIDRAIAWACDKYGRIDSLVNSAYPRNAHYGRTLMEVEYADFCENVNRHLGGYFLTSQRFAECFLAQGYGNIVNIASIYGVIAPRFEIYRDTTMTMPVEYAVIKSALVHLTRYFAKYFQGKNIRVNALSPGGVADGQPDVFQTAYRAHCLNKGMLETTDVSGTLVYLLSDMSARVNGQNIIVDDGFTL